MTSGLLAIVPARGGSKGLPRKNLLDLGGKPLLAHSIEAALATPGIERVVVSTEDEEIARAARQWGAEVPFMRPAELAGDESLLGEAVEHALEALAGQGYRPRAYCLLPPSHPFRHLELMEELAARALEGFATVGTVRRMPPRSYFEPDGARYAPPELAQGPYFRPYGLFAAASLVPASRHFTREVSDPAGLVDIDHAEDLLRARRILAANLFDARTGYLGCCW